MRDEILKHIFDIREATLAILGFVKDKKFEDYEQDELLRSGVERKFGIMGEALKRIKSQDPLLLEKIGSSGFPVGKEIVYNGSQEDWSHARYRTVPLPLGH